MTPWLLDAGRDARQALRQLTRRPAFAAAALLTLVLGLGAPTAIFSIVHAVLLRPLPYPQPDEIMRFRIESVSPRGRVGFDAVPASLALEWAAASSTLSGLALYNERAMTLATATGPVRLAGVAAAPTLFEVLGATPMAGAVFGAADRDVRQVVLSHATWRREFAGNLEIIGELVTLDGDPHRVVGIMPAAFAFPAPDTAFWVPVVLSSGGSRGLLLPAIGRVRTGATIAGVQAEGQRLLDADGSIGESRTLLARTLRDQMVGDVSRVLWVLMAAVSVVSAIATVNIALLLLTRGAGRSREFTIRTALGADRRRLIRLVTVDGLVLAALGGLGGLLFAAGAVEALVRIAPPNVPRLDQASIGGGALLFAGMLVVIAAVIFGALSASRVAGGRLVAAGSSRTRLHGLAAAELALATVLLVGAGLLLRSLVGLVLIDQGFDASDRFALQVTLPSSRYPTPAARMEFHDRLLAQLSQTAGVITAGVATSMPNRQPTGRFAYDPAGVDPFADPLAMKLAEVRMVSEGFFDAMGVQVLEGRAIARDDLDGADPVIVISQALAGVHFPDGDPVGRMLYSHSGDRRVIGVVGDVRKATAEALQHDPSGYVPLRQSVDVFRQFATAHVVVRGRNLPALSARVRDLIRALDPEIAPFNVRTLDDEVAGLVAGPRFIATVLGLFALVAFVMATVGVYGVMLHAASQRTKEIGIRTALGATRVQVLRLMLRDGVVVVGIGLTAGLVATIWAAQALTGLLHEVTPADPSSMLAVAALLSVAGLTAAYIPARRATRLNPLTALRED